MLRLEFGATAVLTAAFAAALIAVSPPAASARGFDAASTSAPNPVGAAPTVSDSWSWPVPAPIRVVSPFRAPPTPYKAGHRGIDLLVEPAATIVAAASGTVSFAGMVAGRGVVAVDHGNGVVSAIEPVVASVAQGDVVSAGDVIGTAASGGHCTGDCVHFGVRVHGEYVSPFLFLGGLPRAVLLPLG
jgi:murein DD-endopeptidase MepM/ murein hydrolase activator NlpD